MSKEYLGHEPRCPYCGSYNIQVITEKETKGYDLASGCCGYICLGGPIGLLCGLLGMGDSKTKTLRMCVSCGKKFR